MATCSELNRPKLTTARYRLFQVAVRSSRQKRDGTEFIGNLKSNTDLQEKGHGKKFDGFHHRPRWKFSLPGEYECYPRASSEVRCESSTVPWR